VVDSLKKAQACEWSFDKEPAFKDISKDAKDFITKMLQKNPEYDD
jgi:hypothetical protein